MNKIWRRNMKGLLLAFALVIGASAQAQSRTAPCTNYDAFPPQAQFPWMGNSSAQSLTINSQLSGACLNAVLYKPAAPPPVSLPAVVMALGAGGNTQNLGWAARYLAGNNYDVLIVSQQGEGGSEVIAPSLCGPPMAPLGLLDGGERLTQVCPGIPPAINIDAAEDAVSSGISWLESQSGLSIDPLKIGASGHSEGARGATAAQMDDQRISAVVAFDNLSTDRSGDQGVCSGGQPQSALTGGQLPNSSSPITARVPSMGQACDNNVGNLPANAKETAFIKWVNTGVPTAEIVFKGWNHLAWAGTGNDAYNASGDVQHQIAAYYARAWFDAYLLGDSSGITRLLAPAISVPNGAANGTTLASLLSTTFYSGVFLPRQGANNSTIYCDQLLTQNCIGQ